MRHIDWKTLTFRDYAHLLIRRKWLIIIPFVLITIISIIVAHVTPPVYLSMTTLIAEEGESRANVLEGLVRKLPFQQQEHLALVRQRLLSHTLLMEVATALNLRDYLERKKGIKIPDTGIISTLRKNSLRALELLRLRRRQTRLTDTEIVRYLRDTISIRAQASIIQISVLYAKPEIAKEIANQLARTYVDDTKRRRMRDVIETREFIDEELVRAQGKLEQSERAVQDAAKAGLFRKLSNENIELVNQIASAEGALIRITMETDDKTAEINQLQASVGSAPPKVLQWQNRVAELEAELVQLRQKYNDSWPDVIKKKNELDSAYQQLTEAEQQATGIGESEIESQIKQLAGERAQLSLTQKTINRKLQQYQDALERLPSDATNLSRLMRIKSQDEARYDFLLKGRYNADFLTATERREIGKIADVLDPAILPDKPIKPNKQMIILAGLVLGLGFGITFLVIREYFDHSIHSLEEAEEYFADVPILGVIPKLSLSKR